MTLLDQLPSLHRAAPMRIDPDVWPVTARVDDAGRLCVGGVPLCELADEYGTPAYVLDAPAGTGRPCVTCESSTRARRY